MPSDSNSKPGLPSRFLVLEGLDGSGKTTLGQRLKEEFASRQIESRSTREPGGTPLAEDIRSLLLRTDGEAPVATTELLLYAASRAQHVAKVIRPALEAGRWVLCDRFLASSVAFQAFARGLPRAETDWLNAFAIQGTRPHLTILLDLPIEESFRRQRSREKDRMENEAKQFHQKVRDGFLALAAEAPGEWLVLDALLPTEELVKRVMTELGSRKWLA